MTSAGRPPVGTPINTRLGDELLSREASFDESPDGYC
jgi:hypothetical protein